MRRTHHSKRPTAATPVTAALLTAAVLCGEAYSEPALLVSSAFTREVMRYHAETGEYLGVHVPKGKLLSAAGLSVGPDGNLYVADQQGDTIVRFDGITGEFIDIYVPAGSGGLDQPSHWAINWPGPSADGHLYVTAEHDSIMRFKGPIPVLPPELDPCADVAAPGDPCPGLAGDPGSAILVPGGPPVGNPMKPFWDEAGRLYASYPVFAAIHRYDSYTGDPLAGPLGDPGSADFVPASICGDFDPFHGAFGSDGNIYMAGCEDGVDVAVRRYAGPTPGGDCAGLTPGMPCAGPLAADPNSADFALGTCRLGGATVGPNGNVYTFELFASRVTRYAGPVPDGSDTRGPCAGMVPGSPCPGPLAASHPAALIPSTHGGLDGPYDILFTDLPPVSDCTPANDDCVASELLPSDLEVVAPFRNVCATTDGPASTDCGGGPQSDVWFHYVAPIDGTLTASTVESIFCNSDACAFDTIVAIYDGDLSCGCPTDESWRIGCNDDFAQAGGPSLASAPVTAGNCYAIRVGGWETEQGAAELRLSTSACVAPAAPLPDLYVAKNRYLSFSHDSGGQLQGVRVTFVDLPAPYDVWNGVQMWVGPPEPRSEIGANNDATPPTFQAAPLRCDQEFREWSPFATVHVYHEGIVPGGIYDLQVVDVGCDAFGESYFSPALEIINSDWGDTVGDFDVSTEVWEAADDSVDVATDVIAALDKFASAPTAPQKARVDVEPALVDFKINITDVTVILDAFAGAGYPFAPAGPPPCS